MTEIVQIVGEYEIQYQTPAGRVKAIDMAIDGAIDSLAWVGKDFEETVRVKSVFRERERRQRRNPIERNQ